jgi:hypothetical protein
VRWDDIAAMLIELSVGIFVLVYLALVIAALV